MFFDSRIHSLAALVLATSLFCCSGCGGGVDGPPMASASGVVTLDGNPVEGATVSFTPKGKGTVSLAMTGADGRFKMMTAAGKDGAAVGEHGVTVTLTVMPDLQAQGSADDLATPQAFETSGGTKAPEEQKPLHLVPQKYNSSQTSGLSVTVPDGGASDIKLELTSK